jgi:hypothetical protein
MEKRNNDKTINIPLDEDINVIIGKKVVDNKLMGFVIQKVNIKIDHNNKLIDVEIIDDEYVIMKEDMQIDEEYFVMGDNIDDTQNYQLLYIKKGEQTGINVFSSNGIDWHC